MTKEIKTLDNPKEKKAMDLRPYLGGLEYDRGVMIREVRNYCGMMATGMYEAGKRLICLKQMEGHGNYLDALQEIGIPQQRANELISIAFLVTNHILSKSPDSGYLERFNTMGITQLKILSRIPEDVLAQFGEDGDIAGMTIDEIKAMSLDQLRDEVRALRGNMVNGKKQNRRLQEQIDHLERQKKGAEGITVEIDKLEIWTGKIFSDMTRISTLLNDEDLPGSELFEGDNGRAAHAILSPIDTLLESIVHQWDKLKGETWGIE